MSSSGTAAPLRSPTDCGNRVSAARVSRSGRLCDPRAVDWAVVTFIAGLAILLAIAIGLQLARERELETLRALADAPDAPTDLAARVR